MTRNQKTALAIGLAAISMLFAAASANAGIERTTSNKPPVIAGTYTPPANVDWGCGKGKPITIRADKNRLCPIGPYKGGKHGN